MNIKVTTIITTGNQRLEQRAEVDIPLSPSQAFDVTHHIRRNVAAILNALDRDPELPESARFMHPSPQ